MTATAEVQSGLEGVVAFATEIAEPDRAGGSLRYRARVLRSTARRLGSRAEARAAPDPTDGQIRRAGAAPA